MAALSTFTLTACQAHPAGSPAVVAVGTNYCICLMAGARRVRYACRDLPFGGEFCGAVVRLEKIRAT